MPAPDPDTQRAVFEALCEVLRPYAGSMRVTGDEAGLYALDTTHRMKNGKDLFFGSVVVNKAYVSFHLMPVYVFPELLDGLSPELRRRMQGKSCFNFKRPEPELVAELAALTKRGSERYAASGYAGGDGAVSPGGARARRRSG